MLKRSHFVKNILSKFIDPKTIKIPNFFNMIQNKYTGECLEPDKIMSPHCLLILSYLKISEQNQYCHVPSCLKHNNYLRLSGFLYTQDAGRKYYDNYSCFKTYLWFRNDFICTD